MKNRNDIERSLKGTRPYLRAAAICLSELDHCGDAKTATPEAAKTVGERLKLLQPPLVG